MKAVPRSALLLAVLMLGLLPHVGLSQGEVDIRQGRHGDMGRLVFEFPGMEHFRSQRNGSELTIEFSPVAPIGTVALRIPGVEAMQGGAGQVRLRLAAGATPHIFRLGRRVVVDTSLGILAPAPASQAQPASARLKPEASRAAAPPLPAPPSPAPSSPARPSPVTPPAPQPITAQPAASQPTAAPPAPLPSAPPPPAASPPAAPVVIGFATQPGAAAFRRGDDAVLVFDTSEIPDLGALQADPLFAGASLESLQDAQIVSVPLPDDDSIALTPASGGWQVAAVTATRPLPAPPQSSNSAVEFPMASANQSVIIADPLTGGDLLVGTVMQGSDAADYRQSGPGYTVLPAWLGVVVVPQADGLSLNASLKGFELVSDAPAGLPLGNLPAQEVAGPPGPGTNLDLPGGSTADLWQRLLRDQRAAAILPPLDRVQAQIILARDMLALGLGPEAAGVLDAAVLENPAAQDNGQIAGMRAVADILAHRSQDSDFSAPGLVPGPELAFWRAVGTLDRGNAEAAIPGLIAGLPIFESYPEALRDTMAAEIAEALADNGQPQAALQLTDSDPDNKLLNLARARILEEEGQAASAFSAYQAVARGDDTRMAAIAEARVVELELASGRLTPAQAADALDAQLFNWRDPQHERHLRLRIADLRAQAGQWPQAFTMLASARRLFPGHRQEINSIRAAMFLKMLRGNAFARLTPIEALALLQQNQDLAAQSGDSAQVLNLLASQLAALDLPGAAAPMLSHLIENVPDGAARAGLGATLAQVDLDAGSPVAALADLAQTQADDLPTGLVAQRNLLAARAQAAAGNAIAAVDTLAPAASAAIPSAAPSAAVPDTEALQAQAQIAEQSGQWPQAEQALGALVSQSIPASGPLGTDQENLLLRLATAASHNNDSATLAALNAQYAGRVGADAAGQMFQTLTAPPLTGDQGLNQALHEISRLQALPAMVNAVAKLPDTGQPAQSSVATPQ